MIETITINTYGVSIDLNAKLSHGYDDKNPTTSNERRKVKISS